LLYNNDIATRASQIMLDLPLSFNKCHSLDEKAKQGCNYQLQL